MQKRPAKNPPKKKILNVQAKRPKIHPVVKLLKYPPLNPPRVPAQISAHDQSDMLFMRPQELARRAYEEVFALRALPDIQPGDFRRLTMLLNTLNSHYIQEAWGILTAPVS
jgi:hypothetical protein